MSGPKLSAFLMTPRVARLLLCALLLGVFLVGPPLAMRAGDAILVGKPAPEIEGKDIDGRVLKLSDYRGKVVLLSFWGDW